MGVKASSFPKVPIDFGYRDSTYFTELTLELYAYDTSSCLAVFNGGTPRLVDRSAVTTLTDALDSLFTEE